MKTTPLSRSSTTAWTKWSKIYEASPNGRLQNGFQKFPDKRCFNQNR
jgi:hypothetical protein